MSGTRHDEATGRKGYGTNRRGDHATIGYLPP
jgi:hypothetical protein